uniref:Uncharacterized protein n=1 Tax=uncultured marine virus TaxID=186617 RepID=A0A0F7LAM3_9VIRU|nr:hypothetical protein [uncultured marine virus]
MKFESTFVLSNYYVVLNIVVQQIHLQHHQRLTYRHYLKLILEELFHLILFLQNVP